MTAHPAFQQRLARLIRTASREHGYDGETGEAFTSWQETVRQKLTQVLGFPAIRAAGACELEPERQGTITHDGYERQRWQVQTEPGVRVPFCLLVPDDEEPPYPVVLTIHGHCEEGKALTVGAVDDERVEIAEERRDFARQAVRRGYAALAPDMRAFGELAGPEPEPEGYRSCTRLQKTAQLFGRTLAGERTWDVLRLIECIESEPTLDGDRIAITGHSGGAAVSLFAAAVDDRLAPAVLNAYFCTFADSIVAIDHCDCNYVPGLLRLGEMWDIAGAIAPRPVTVVTGDGDPIFPVNGTRRAFSRLQEIYRNVGVENACGLSVGSGAHRYYPDHVWPAIGAHL
ncbi:alpha/beta hydrolase family protein [Halocatena pleomorpha]|uniref:Acetylxylan esterase n=1 Tax=Halocatena pleomorpha TaxID=1785090 RepID=A0A3P3RC90_9EURY|nr:alpha/beta hydrolase family protein [Halocatena pleomorpha]RRJ30093.1 hypothetical protein EIK79_10945 [Halocatena pleomorpha]